MAFAPLSGAVVRGLPVTPGQTNGFSQRFAVGQTLRGVVLRALPEGKTLVNFAGQHVELELNQPLARGQTFLATVEQSSPALMLKVVARSASGTAGNPALLTEHQAAPPNRGNATLPGTFNAAQLKSYLVAKQPVIDMLVALQTHLVRNPVLQHVDATLRQRLETTLNTLLPEAASPPDAAGLKAQIAQSGINYEATIQHLLTNDASPTEQAAVMQNLKGQLLELLQELNQLPAQQADVTAARQQVQQALQNIEFQQLANLFAHQEDQFLLLQFVHPAFPESHTAQLFFRANHKSKRANRGETEDYTLVFLLDFTALGNIRIDATVQGPQVWATIRTEDEAVAHFIAAQTSSLTNRLQELGFQTEISCCAQETVSLDVDDSLTRLLMVDPSHLVDTKA
ncbi:MAG: hypothetical protein V3S24_10310 [Candidatus Tectomicrobia bacterium]